MKNITVGYLDLADKKLLSGIVINKNFVDLVSHYVNVKIVPIAQRKDLQSRFEEMAGHGWDYLYIDSYEILVESFLLRERLRLPTPFIFTIHTVLPWALNYARAIPLIRKDDIILAPSKYAKESFRRISDKFDVHIIPYSLDVSRILDVADDHRTRSGKTVAYMGRLTEKKGVGTLIRCVPELVKKVGDVRLNIIGPLSGSASTDSPKGEYVKALEAEIKKLGLADRVNLMGVRLGAEKYRLLSQSDVFINPTLAKEETFSIVNIEALACGLPVIATDWGANREIVVNGKNGYLAAIREDARGSPCVSADQLVLLTAKVLKNPEVTLKLKEGAIKSAQRYDHCRIFPKLIRLLKKRKLKEGQGRWGLIKDKSFGHFDHLFNRDFLFFIHAANRGLRMDTYADLYDRIIKSGFFRDAAHAISDKTSPDKDSAYKKMVGATSRDYENFLCLRRRNCLTK